MLARFALTPQDLLLVDTSSRARPVLVELIKNALDHFREAIEYTLSIPAFSIRLRLACLWPVFIGLETLVVLAENDRWLDPSKVSKIRRGDVYRIIVLSIPLVTSNTLLRIWAERLIARIETRMNS